MNCSTSAGEMSDLLLDYYNEVLLPLKDAVQNLSADDKERAQKHIDSLNDILSCTHAAAMYRLVNNGSSISAESEIDVTDVPLSIPVCRFLTRRLQELREDILNI